MTGENTRLDNSAIDDKHRSESRYNLPRRRAAKTISYSHSGSYENDLALAVQESLLMAKQAEAKRQSTTMDENTNDQNCPALAESKSGNVISDKNRRNENDKSSKYLKDLLLVNLDLVQHQQEMISQKDKEIKKLKTERDTLQCRLDRMERRMALLKQREELESTSPFTKSFITPRLTAASPAARRIKTEVTETEEISVEDRGVKRKSNLEPENLSKKLATSSEISKVDKTEKMTSRLSHKGKRRTIQIPVTEDQEPVGVVSRQRQKPCTVTSSSENEEESTIVGNKKSVPSIIKEGSHSDRLLRTNDLYYVSYYEPVSEEIDVSCRKDIIKNAQTQLQVETPSWKPKKYPSLWVMEGTENVEDEVYVKRHQKLEIEEKRRKRWDLQRMREQKIYDKLREKEATCSKKEEETLESFYPRLEDITHIEVSDFVPVMAFGHPLPSLNKVDFELPWEVTTKSTVTSTTSSSRGRSARHR
ncbi:hypothetical protein FSP39_008351 [Pinctada imbricata]|uniref:PEHE domain-containing protein n=1 Tax=Pinctada imbricata TaxID=66713 RepID=A0AA89CDV5_PINIB|nr:hypothetical protein FSP39_008351 [Pinctada imbricata]